MLPPRRPVPDLHSKLILAPATSSYRLTAFFFMSDRRDTRIVISVYAARKKDYLSLRSKAKTEKRQQGTTLPDRPLERERLRKLPVHLHHLLWVLVQHADPFAELQFESAALQNRSQKSISKDFD